MRLICLLFLLLSVESSWALYGKVQPRNKRYPFVGSLSLRDADDPGERDFCSAILISPTRLITAGHCIDAFGIKVFDYGDYLVYHPEKITVRLGRAELNVKYVDMAPSYHDGLGISAEDLAILDLESPVKGITPVKLALYSDLFKGQEAILVARNRVARSKITGGRTSAESKVIYTDGSLAGTCLGDSGGALLIEKNGETKLAGILGYRGKQGCDQKTSVSFFPRAHF